MKKFKVGIAGMVHDHIWNELPHWRDLPNVELVASADINEPLRQKAKDAFGILRSYDSWADMLRGEALDIVQIGAENSVCADIAEACAARNLHIISEKPMAATLEQADRMITAAENANVKLFINWATAWSPAIQEWLQRIDAGEIGAVTHVKYRSAHNGPKEIGCSEFFWSWLYDAEKNGAGSLMDYCSYGADFMAYFLGLPDTVMGMRATFAKEYPVPDDNAMIVAQYKHAFGIAEASWTQVGGPAEGANPIAYGTEGSLAVSQQKVVLRRSGQQPLIVDPPAAVFPYRSGPEYFVHCIENNLLIEGLCSPKVSRDAQEILEAGLRSSDMGVTISLPVKQSTASPK